MRRLINILLLLTVANITWATTVYESVDSNGTVSFSDQQQPAAKKIILNDAKFSEQTKLLANKLRVNREVVAYQSVEIDHPQNNATVRNNSGFATFSITVNPRLNKGDKLQLFIDGKASGEPQTSQAFAIKGLYRGSHTAFAQVVDSKGNIVAKSSAITFYMHSARANMVPKKASKKKKSKP